MATAELSVVTENLPGSQVGLTIEVPQEAVDEAYERVLKRLSQRVKIEGFRPGHAPKPLIEARIGPAALREEVIDALVPQAVNQALKERSIEPIDRPQVEVLDLERGRPARLSARVSVMPEVQLPELAGMKVDKQHTEVDDDMVERRLLELRERLAEIEPVEREVRPGDLVVADLKVATGGQEVASEARNAMEMEVREGVLVPELLAVLPGKKVGEVATAEVTMPEDHSNPDLAGKLANLEVTVQGVKEKRVPELTDEIAQQLSDGERKTAAELREAVREDLVEQARRLDELAHEQSVLKAVVEGTQVEVPKALVDHEVEHQVSDLEERLKRQGLRIDRYLQYLNQTPEEYLDGLRPDAAARLKVDLVLSEFGKRLGIEPTDEEVEAYIRTEAERDPELKGSLDQLLANGSARDYFRHRLERLRILETLVKEVGKEA